jgi:translation elongation factor EF-Tu-like GTPase
MRWPWQRKGPGDRSRDVDVLLAQSRAASPPSGPFRMVVADVFTIRGRGTVATGRVETGTVRVGQQVRILRAGTELMTTTVTAVEMFRRSLDSASAGDDVGLLLDGASDVNVMREDVLEG